jgi:predicted aconitase
LVEAISAACPHAPMAEILELANLCESLENGLAVVIMEAQ